MTGIINDKLSMMNESADHRWNVGIALTLLCLASLLRLAPHLPNVAPIGAIALFAGARLTGRWIWLVPIAALLATDALIGWYTPAIMATVYGSFALIALLGRFLKNRSTVPSILGFSLIGSVFFFLTTNFAVWTWTLMYPPTAAGLVASYVNALPFFRNSVLGDLGYTALIFGLYALAVAAVQRQRATSTSQHSY